MKNDKLVDVLHSTAAGLHKAGAMDLTMREFDALCLPPVQNYDAEQIKGIRLRFKVSQAVFAAYLNTTPSSIQQWERGITHSSGMALKLRNLVDSKGLRQAPHRPLTFQ